VVICRGGEERGTGKEDVTLTPELAIVGEVGEVGAKEWGWWGANCNAKGS